jgi:hypothetical protein
MTVVEKPNFTNKFLTTGGFKEMIEIYDIEVVNLDLSYPGWQNKHKTVVFRVSGMPFSLAMDFAADLANLHPSECGHIELDGYDVFRLLWK